MVRGNNLSEAPKTKVTFTIVTAVFVLLLWIGFATDLLGLLIIFPPTRKLILKKMSTKQTYQNKEQDFINGEYEDIEEKDDNRKI